MQSNFGLHFLGKRWHFRSEKCADTERDSTAFDAPFPIFEGVLDAYQGIVDLIIKRLHTLRNPGTVASQNCCDEPGLRREIMMNARLSDLYSLRNVGVAES